MIGTDTFQRSEMM